MELPRIGGRYGGENDVCQNDQRHADHRRTERAQPRCAKSKGLVVFHRSAVRDDRRECRSHCGDEYPLMGRLEDDHRYVHKPGPRISQSKKDDEWILDGHARETSLTSRRAYYNAAHGDGHTHARPAADDAGGTTELPTAASHPIYARLNQLLREHRFDDFAETRCAEFYAETMGRPGLPPGIYFRLLMVGYFEGLDSERGIAWRAADSLTLRDFLGLTLPDAPPDHSTISRTRRLIDLQGRLAALIALLVSVYRAITGGVIPPSTVQRQGDHSRTARPRQIMSETRRLTIGTCTTGC